MSPDQGQKFMQSRIWLEEPEPDNPFAARAAYCHGYDVYGEMIGSAGWADMIFLLFRGEAPTRAQAAALDLLAVALANPGPRNPSVHAAMCGGVGGSTAAASLMAALAAGAGNFSGAREVRSAMEAWEACGLNRELWRSRMSAPAENISAGWPDGEHAPGFDPHGTTVSVPVMQTLARLSGFDPASRTAWLWANRPALEACAGHPLSLMGVAAAAFADLGFSPAEGEMLCLLLRLPGAAAHALEQGETGHKKFPFYGIELDQAARTGDGTAGEPP